MAGTAAAVVRDARIDYGSGWSVRPASHGFVKVLVWWGCAAAVGRDVDAAHDGVAAAVVVGEVGDVVLRCYEGGEGGEEEGEREMHCW